jgi:hypothetical protein
MISSYKLSKNKEKKIFLGKNKLYYLFDKSNTRKVPFCQNLIFEMDKLLSERNGEIELRENISFSGLKANKIFRAAIPSK